MAKDLSAIELGKLPWDDGNRDESLGHVYDHVVGNARSAIEWYRMSRRPKKWWAMWLRWLAVLLVSASGVVPLVAAMMEEVDPLNPLVTSLMVALAAALFGLDKVFNYSTAWMRYVRTELELRTALSEFQFEWQIARAAWGMAEPTSEQATAALGRCSAFAGRVNAIVTAETNAWITEFQASLAQLGETVKAAEARVEAAEARRTAAAGTGALNVSVKHGDQTWAGEFRLRVDGDAQGKLYVGPNVALVDLPPGPHRLAAEFSRDGTLHRGEFAVDVVAGRTSQATVEAAPVDRAALAPPIPPIPPITAADPVDAAAPADAADPADPADPAAPDDAADAGGRADPADPIVPAG